ncbi:MAG TPA: YtcA family lipoprotein [Candidatus Binatia bacterium]|nr:YtcA family lipoprotein [Candidatus Binatia bacterium]
MRETSTTTSADSRPTGGSLSEYGRKQRGENFDTMYRCGVVTLALLASGCDPIVNVYGSFFPAWVVCLVVGVLLTVLLRLVFAVARVERHLGPLILIYPSLTLLLTLLTWLVFFQT